MARKQTRLDVTGGEGLAANPFHSLASDGLPSGPAPDRDAPPAAPKTPERRSRGRLDVRREKAGRGGKTVTVISGWKGISPEEKAALAKTMQKTCGVGGAVKDGKIELQGDKREAAKAVLEAAGFRVVFAGG